jgi:predicted metal-dependent enzyme (double-stranded beta helix superfamily)
LDRIVAEDTGDIRRLVHRTRELLVGLLADTSWLDPRCYEQRPNSVQYLLHKHPDNAYTVVSVVFPVGYSTTVHDHGAWGLVGVWRGEEQEERFKRVDDGSRPGFAELRLSDTVLNTPGCVTHLIPPDEEIHRIRNLAPFPSCSIHIYGADIDGRPRHQFDLETGEIKPFVTQSVALD